MALLLASCSGHLPLADLPAPLTVALSTTCEQILAPVAVPDDQPGDDAIAAYLGNRAQLIVAATEIDLGRDCIKRQRQDYAGKNAKTGGH